jgi:hypothetical protein
MGIMENMREAEIMGIIKNKRDDGYLVGSSSCENEKSQTGLFNNDVKTNQVNFG